MFYCSKEELLVFSKMLQRHFCAYDMGGNYQTPKMCDCKYGATLETVGKMSEAGCGCPEMRCIVKLLTGLPLDDYKQIMEGKE